ncbi:MAG: low specificity L-threonine aldolase [Bacteroidales bacterium]|jgi:threonine aldolase|nr:low specificity L-threonine aldolase [Bacteroidales bacterium]MDD4385369.1 low specificity L-threonine aldolase [Bacteroidales bacterium]MDY0196794.1 low specificity L-threonine aldolase [Tenuifilaceae bacterium]
MNQNKRGFASDNNSGVHPNILEAMNSVNHGHTIAYGDDPYTEEATKVFKTLFGNHVEVFFVFIGSAANVLGIKAATQPYHAVITPDTAHINVDECGAPERFTGCKLLTVSTPDGKLTVDLVQKHMHGFGFQHHSQPKVISISQPTELGTLYTPDEVRTLANFAHQHNMYLHMDGARIANAAAALDKSFKEFTTDAGVDILSFGGTKNGMMYGEAVVFFNPDLAKEFMYTRKQGLQLASKMRYISAQFTAYLSNNQWHKTASHANRMAKILAAQLESVPQVKVTQPVQVNGVFAIIPKSIIEKLQAEYFFYTWDDEKSEVRWMTSWDTTEDDIKNFVAKIKELLA